MITEQTTASTLRYIAALDTAGIALTAMAATPLAALSAASSSVHGLAIGSNSIVLNTADMAIITNNEQHAGTLTAIVNTLAPAIKEHIRVAQTIVNPVVVSVIERAEELSKYFVSGRIADLQVSRVSMATPLTMGNLVNVINSFTPSESITLGALRIFPAMSAEQLLQLMQVGSTDVDEVIAKWFYAQPAGFFQRVWQSFFLSTKEEHVKGGNYTMENVKWDSQEGTGIALALFMWCNRMHGNPMENMDATQGYTMMSYNNYLVDMRAQAARRLTDIIEMQKSREETGALIHSIDSIGKTINVNEAVYLKWLDKDDGSNEILYGLLITGDKVTMTEDINASKERYLKVFYDFSVLAKDAEAANWAINMRKALIDCLNEQICQAEISNNAKTLAYTKSRELIYALPEQRMRCDLYSVCLELVHALLFPGTASIVILKGINLAKENDPNLSVREAATVSIMRYIAMYVAGMIMVGDAATGRV